MAKDRKLDPVTRDYVPDGRGGFEYVETVETQMLHQILDQRGKWWGGPGGSDVGKLQQAHLNERGRLLGKRSVEVALQEIVDTGRARELRVSSSLDLEHQRIEVEASMVDVSNGDPGTALVVKT